MPDQTPDLNELAILENMKTKLLNLRKLFKTGIEENWDFYQLKEFKLKMSEIERELDGLLKSKRPS